MELWGLGRDCWGGFRHWHWNERVGREKKSGGKTNDEKHYSIPAPSLNTWKERENNIWIQSASLWWHQGFFSQIRGWNLRDVYGSMEPIAGLYSCHLNTSLPPSLHSSIPPRAPLSRPPVRAHTKWDPNSNNSEYNFALNPKYYKCMFVRQRLVQPIKMSGVWLWL